MRTTTLAAKRSTMLARALTAIALLLSVLTLPACTTLGDLTGWRDRTLAERDRLEQHAAAIEAALEATPPDDPLAREARAEAAAARERARLLDDDARRIGDAIARAEQTSDPIARAVGAVAPFLPEPARTPLVLAAALGGAMLRARELRRGLTSVARGFEIAKRDDPEFNARFAAHTGTFRAVRRRWHGGSSAAP